MNIKTKSAISAVLFLLILQFISPFSNAQTINIGPNQYAFRFTQNPNYGLFFNATNVRYDFRNGLGQPIFSFNADNGNLTSNLQFATGNNFLVPANTFAFRASTNQNIGIVMGSSAIEVRTALGTPSLSLNHATGNATFSGTITASGGNSGQWNQAFGWGNHSNAGYITSESDPKIGNLANTSFPFWNGTQLVNSLIQQDGGSIRINSAPAFTEPSQLIINNNHSGSIFTVPDPNISLRKNGVESLNLRTAGNDVVLEGKTTGEIQVRQSGTKRLSILPVSGALVVSANPTLGNFSVLAIDNLNSGTNINFPAAAYLSLRRQGTEVGLLRATTGETVLESASGNLIFRTASSDRLTISSTGNVAVGTTPSAVSPLIVQRSTAGVTGAALEANVTYTGSSDVRAIRSISNTAPGFGIGLQSEGGWKGVDAVANAGEYTGTSYGLFANCTGGSAGTRIGVYGAASGGNAAWAGYFQGNTYVSGDLRIGNLTGANGFKLAVNGKIMSTEVQVQALANWPDYVFGESHTLMPLNELENYVKKEHHLPGIPSAEDIKAKGGMELGEMQRLAFEKIEELTLYLIEQDRMLKQQQEILIQQQHEIKLLKEQLAH